MSDTELRAHYLGYLATLDARRWDDLPRFVADELVYNGMPRTGAQYREMLEDDVRRIPDLVFAVQHLAVDGDLVACRIGFDCTPVQPFQGRRPTGARVQFTEHVFYRFRQDRIVRVWSLLDVEALARQLPAA